MRKLQEYDDMYPYAFLASVMVNIQRGKKGEAITPESFIGKRPTKSTPQSVSPEQRQKDIEAAQRLGVQVPK